MKLYTSPISPFARKAMIMARKKGIADQIKEIPPVIDGAHGYSNSSNPLGKIPALERDGKVTLFDSSVICEYLDGLADPWLPAGGEERFEQLRLHALGDGISVAVYNYRYEIVRPDELHWGQMIERHETSLTTAIDALEKEVDALGDPWKFGNVSVVCGLSYMGFRAGHIDWRGGAPNLARWYRTFEADPVYQDTYAYD